MQHQTKNSGLKFKVLLWTFLVVSTVVYLFIIPNVMSLFVTTKDTQLLKEGYYQFVKGLDEIYDENVRLNDPSALIEDNYLLIYSWNINERNVNYYTNYEGSGYESDFKLIDAVLASSANPNYFKPA